MRFLLFSGILVWLSLGEISWAYSRRSDYNSEMDDFETGHILSIGGGISSPSVTSSLGENPAGLSNNHQTKFLAAAAWTNPSFNPLGLEGLFFLGNGYVGGGLGVQTFNGQGNNAGSITFFDFGIAAVIEPLNLSIGASGSYTLSQYGVTSGTGSGSTVNSDVGLIFNPKGGFRVGASAYQIINGVSQLGLGFAVDASEWATFAIDGTMTPQTNGKIIKPAMGIHLMDFQFTLGYGLVLDTTGLNWIRQGGSFGLGVRISQNFNIQAYYNDLALYYFGLTVRI